jgi:hypothetical protein
MDETVHLNRVAVLFGSDSPSHPTSQPFEPSLLIPSLNSSSSVLTAEGNLHVL